MDTYRVQDHVKGCSRRANVNNSIAAFLTPRPLVMLSMLLVPFPIKSKLRTLYGFPLCILNLTDTLPSSSAAWSISVALFLPWGIMHFRGG